MPIEREDMAWLAGFFDGEGSIGGADDKKRRRFPRLTIVQKDITLLQRCVDLTGMGHIYTHQSQNGTSRWVVDKIEHVQQIMCWMWPWLSERRKLRYSELRRL